MEHKKEQRALTTIPKTCSRLKAEGYDVSATALRRWIKTGKIAHVAVGNRTLVLYENVIRFLEQGA